MTADRPRRKSLDILVAIVGIVAGLWASYWYLANQISFAAMRHAIAAAAPRHGTAECAGMTSAGFPLRLEVGCRGLRFADTGNGVSMALGALSAKAPLYWPLTLDTSLAGPLVLDGAAEGTPLTASWTAATAHVSGGFRGLSQAFAALRSLDLAGAIALPRLALSGISAESADLTVAPAPDKAAAYRLTFALKGVRLEAADARDLPPIKAAGQAALLDFGSSLGFDPRRAVSRWVGKGGALRLDSLSLTAGPVSANASGDLRLSPDGLLSGKLVVRFVGLEQLPAVLEAFQPGSRTASQMARVLMVVTRKVETPTGPARETILNLSDGFVSVGIVPIAAIPPLRF